MSKTNEKFKNSKITTVGVLAIQGSVEEHVAVLRKMKTEVKEVRHLEDLKNITHLIIPGGESTTMAKLMREYYLDKEIIKKARSGLKIYGTCAGMILLSKNNSHSLKLTSIEVDRNAYGRQLDSFETELTDIDSRVLKVKKLKAVFIRAPKITNISAKTKVLASYEDYPVLVQEGNFLLGSFHPELTNDKSVYKYFLST